MRYISKPKYWLDFSVMQSKYERAQVYRKIFSVEINSTSWGYMRNPYNGSLQSSSLYFEECGNHWDINILKTINSNALIKFYACFDQGYHCMLWLIQLVLVLLLPKYYQVPRTYYNLIICKAAVQHPTARRWDFDQIRITFADM